MLYVLIVLIVLIVLLVSLIGLLATVLINHNATTLTLNLFWDNDTPEK
jgi:hypothetical protein